MHSISDSPHYILGPQIHTRALHRGRSTRFLTASSLPPPFNPNYSSLSQSISRDCKNQYLLIYLAECPTGLGILQDVSNASQAWNPRQFQQITGRRSALDQRVHHTRACTLAQHRDKRSQSLPLPKRFHTSLRARRCKNTRPVQSQHVERTPNQ